MAMSPVQGFFAMPTKRTFLVPLGSLACDGRLCVSRAHTPVNRVTMCRAAHCAIQPLSTACYGTNDRNWDKTNRERVAGAVHDSCCRPSDLGLGLGWRRLHEEAIERLGGEVRAQTCSTRATDGGNKDHVVRH